MKRLLAAIFRFLAEHFAKTNLAELYVVKVVGDWVASMSRAEMVEHDGHTIFLDDRDSLRLSVRGYFEPFQTELVKSMVKPRAIVVDVGANIGYYTLILARLVGPEGRVFAFEPDPENFALLKKNIETNGYDNVILVQKAVSNVTGPMKLFKEKTKNTSASIWQMPHSRSQVTIEATTLDDFLDAYPEYAESISLIKMDIEGAEGLALQGMIRTLERNRSVAITSEIHGVGLEACGTPVGEYIRRWQELGFTVEEISEEEKEIRPVDVESFSRLYTADQHTYTNILCRRAGVE